MHYYNDKTLLYLNGQFLKSAKASTDLYAQSLHYGYAVFEGMRAYNTHNGVRIFKAREHFDRLKFSCDKVNIPYKWDNEQLIDDAYHLLDINRLKDAYIRPLIYSAPNMKLTQPTSVSLMMCAWDWAPYLGEKLLKVGVSSYQRPNPRSIHVDAKISGHNVSSILANTEVRDKGYDEALLLDMNDNIAQSPGANFFMEKNGKLYTPPDGHIFPGITRKTVLEICRFLSIEVVEKHLKINDLKNATAAFFCGTATEIVGIKSIDNKILETDWQDTVGATIQRTYKNLVLEKENYEVII